MLACLSASLNCPQGLKAAERVGRGGSRRAGRERGRERQRAGDWGGGALDFQMRGNKIGAVFSRHKNRLARILGSWSVITALLLLSLEYIISQCLLQSGLNKSAVIPSVRPGSFVWQLLSQAN